MLLVHDFSVPANRTSANRCIRTFHPFRILFITPYWMTRINSCDIHSIQCLRQQQATNIYVLGRDDRSQTCGDIFVNRTFSNPRSVIPLIRETPFTSKVTGSTPNQWWNGRCRRCHLVTTIGSFSNDDRDALEKKYFYFTLECHSCVNLFNTPISLKSCSG